MKKRKKHSFPVKPVLVLGAAAILLAGSTVGSTRAALTYYSENYAAQIEMSSIGVTLLENEKEVSWRNYTEDGTWVTNEDAKLLTDLLKGENGEDEKFTPGKSYKEELAVANTGSIDTFVRVIVTRSWQDENGKKDTTLAPELIELKTTEGTPWVQEDSEAAGYSKERMVFYYTEALQPGTKTEALSSALRINPEIAESVEVVTDKETGTTSYVYTYDGYSFTLEAEVDAVQTHNAVDAIKSAWGVDVTVSADGNTISLQ